MKKLLAGLVLGAALVAGVVWNDLLPTEARQAQVQDQWQPTEAKTAQVEPWQPTEAKTAQVDPWQPVEARQT